MAGGCVPRRVYGALYLMPALHVERLYVPSIFAELFAFCCEYVKLTKKRPLLKVITPRAPLLANSLEAAGFTGENYASLIRQLSQVADIGLHGHYLRGTGENAAPCHNYWSDRQTVLRQLQDELQWLTERELLTVPAYSAGWWYLDDSVLAALEQVGFKYDFSMSARRYNRSMMGRKMLSQKCRPGEITQISARIKGIWALQGLESESVSAGAWRAIMTAFGASSRRKGRSYFSLYGHDWDLKSRTAIDSLRWYRDRGIRFFECADLPEASNGT